MKNLSVILLFGLTFINGQNWEKLKFEPNSPITSIEINTSNVIYISTLDNGAFYSSDYGKSWNEINLTSQFEIYDIAFDSKGHTFFLNFKTLIISTESKIDTIISGYFGDEIVIDHNDNIIINTGIGTTQSYDSGLTWSFDSTFNMHETYRLNIDKHDNLYISVKHGLGHEIESGLFKSINRGRSWQYLFFYGDSNIETAFTQSNQIYALSYSKLYISSDLGDSWHLLNEDHQREFINLIVDRDNKLYALAYGGGIYQYSKLDSLWFHINTIGLTDSLITCMVFDSSNVAYVGTENGFLFKNVNPTTGLNSEKKSIPTEFKLYQNNPNPFNSITFITYFINKENNVKLKIYNNLGEELLTLVNKHQYAGNHKAMFDATNLTSGIYYYVLRCDNTFLSKKMVYIK